MNLFTKSVRFVYDSGFKFNRIHKYSSLLVLIIQYSSYNDLVLRRFLVKDLCQYKVLIRIICNSYALISKQTVNKNTVILVSQAILEIRRYSPNYIKERFNLSKKLLLYNNKKHTHTHIYNIYTHIYKKYIHVYIILYHFHSVIISLQLIIIQRE